MIIAHLGVAFAARRRWPEVSLAWLAVATYAPDLWRAVLYVAGVRDANMYSHALPWCLGLAALLGWLAGRRGGDRRAMAVVGGIVMSHVALDMISGTKQLWPGGPIGLDMWHFQQAEFLLETSLFVLGWIALRRTTAPAWLRGWPVAITGVCIAGAVMMISIGTRRYLERCPAYPILDCDERNWLTRKWNEGIVPLEWTWT
jgi:hypothetical protein